MLATKLYAPTLREVPSDADVVSQQLYASRWFLCAKLQMVYIAFLPLGVEKYQKKLKAIVREEMDRASAQEIMMPILHLQKFGKSLAVGTHMAQK